MLYGSNKCAKVGKKIRQTQQLNKTKRLKVIQKLVQKYPQCIEGHLALLNAKLEDVSYVEMLQYFGETPSNIKKDKQYQGFAIPLLKNISNKALAYKDYSSALIAIEEIEKLKSNLADFCALQSNKFEIYKAWHKENSENGALENIIMLSDQCSSYSLWKNYYIHELSKKRLKHATEYNEKGKIELAKNELRMILVAGLDRSDKMLAEIERESMILLYNILLKQEHFTEAKAIALSLKQLGEKSASKLYCQAAIALVRYHLRGKNYVLAKQHLNDCDLYCKSYNKSLKDSVVIKLSSELLNKKNLTIDDSKYVLSLLNEVNSGEQDSAIIHKIRTQMMQASIKICRILIENNSYDEALYYLNSILLYFPKEQELLYLKAQISMHMGYYFKEKRMPEEAYDWFTSAADSDISFWKEASLEKANIMFCTFQYKKAQKIYEEVFKNTTSNDSQNFISAYRMACYAAIQGKDDWVKYYLPSYCSPYYEMARSKAQNDESFYNLQNKEWFANWLTANRNIELYDFTLTATINQDEQEFLADKNNAAEHYFVIYDNYNRVVFDNSNNYIIFRQPTNTFPESYILKGYPIENPIVTYTIQVRESDLGVVEDNSVLTSAFSIDKCSSSYRVGPLENQYYSIYFNVRETAGQPSTWPTYREISIIQIIYDFTGCAIVSLFGFEGFLLWSIVDAAVQEKEFITEDFVEDAVIQYFSSRGKSSSISQMMGFIPCLTTLARDLVYNRNIHNNLNLNIN